MVYRIIAIKSAQEADIVFVQLVKQII